MTTANRRQRGHDTERAVAGFFADNGWPYAEPVGSGRSGRDVTGVPGLAIEVKSRRDYNPLAWLKQCVKTSGNDLPLVVHRPDGMGPASVASWPVTMRLVDVVELLAEAGYGDHR